MRVEVFDYENLILILQLGQTTKNNIIDTINKFKNYKKEISAILVLKVEIMSYKFFKNPLFCKLI